ncbi:MAG: hydroxyacid dehydrogenase [Gammaproteobacteria bacterium RIFCSPHIGHO2_12_FULL_36_30]|nr:MAG: hydroxyacid dehydrogenase [Gammaproteobacteria bacterium RIFCSPHIGHO2_12_FULL_36_30]
MTKFRCAILDDYQNIALKIADWSVLSDKIDIIVFPNHFKNEAELISALHDKEIIVIMRERTPFTKSLFEHLPKLKLLITSGPRNASIDLETAKKFGVVVCGTASHKEPPMELTWGLILNLARNISLENNAIKSSGIWQSTVGVGLKGKTLGLLGLGKIGSLMVPVAKAFGMQVMAWSENLTADRTEALEISFAKSKQELLRESDFISIHLVLSDRTRHLLMADDLKCMKRTSYLINTSRAQIVDQVALIQALKENWIAGAGLDVFEIEPLPSDHVLRQLKNVVVTPHLGYVTQENYHIFFGEAVENIVAFLNGSPIRALK